MNSMNNVINKNELMIGNIFEIKLQDKYVKVKIFKIGNKQVDILINEKENVCLIDSLIPIKLNDNILIDDLKFEKRQLKINGENINDFIKIIENYFILLKVDKNNKYSLSITIINGEKICDSFNIEYLHNLQNIIRSNIKEEII